MWKRRQKKKEMSREKDGEDRQEKNKQTGAENE